MAPSGGDTRGELRTDAARRRRGIALATTLALGPGAGHALFSTWQRGLLFGIPSVVAGMLVLESFVVASPWGAWPWVGLLVASFAGALLDLWRHGVRDEEPSGHSLAIHVVTLVLTGVLGSIFLRLTSIDSFRSTDNDMLPTLLRGDQLLLDKANAAHPQRGDVVIFRSFEGGLRALRVIGLPGDLVELREGTWWVNRQPLDQCPVGEAELAPGRSASIYVEWSPTRKPYLVAYPPAAEATHHVPSTPPTQRHGPQAIDVGEDQLVAIGDDRGTELEHVPLTALRGVGALLFERSHPGFRRLDELSPPPMLGPLRDSITRCLSEAP